MSAPFAVGERVLTPRGTVGTITDLRDAFAWVECPGAEARWELLGSLVRKPKEKPEPKPARRTLAEQAALVTFKEAALALSAVWEDIDDPSPLGTGYPADFTTSFEDIVTEIQEWAESYEHVLPLPQLTEAQWAAVHGEEAESQGWGLFDSDTRGLEIERDDSAGIFDDDDAALLYVQRQAKRGNVCAVEALRIVAEAQARRCAFNGFNPEAADRTLLAIQDLLDGVAWTDDTLDDIAKVMIEAGYEIRGRK